MLTFGRHFCVDFSLCTLCELVQRCDYPKRKKQELDLPLFPRHFGVSFAQNFHPKYDSKASTF